MRGWIRASTKKLRVGGVSLKMNRPRPPETEDEDEEPIVS